MSGALVALEEALVIVLFIQGAGRLKDPTRPGFLKDAFTLIPPERQESIRNKGRYLESIGLLKMDISLFVAI